MNTGSAKSTIDKWRKLADFLVTLTDSGDLNWKESADDETFITSISENVVSIERTRAVINGETQPIVAVSVLGKRGQVVDRFNDEDIGGEYWTKLSNLIDNITRQLSGADDILDDILGKLEEKSRIPF